MPNITIFISSENMPKDTSLKAITDQCKQLCTEVLKAALENVHIIFVAVDHGCGRLAFAEIKYRLESFRTRPVMDLFMERLDEVLQRHTGLTARIRCFGYTEGAIHARN